VMSPFHSRVPGAYLKFLFGREAVGRLNGIVRPLD